MKRYLAILGMALGLCLVANTAKSEVTYTLIAEDFEDGQWNGFSNYPSNYSSFGIVNAGDTIYGAPETGVTGTWMPSSGIGSGKNGKVWPAYLAPGDVEGNIYYQVSDLGTSLLRGSTVTFKFDSYISSWDVPQANTNLLAFVKFFSAGFSYYYDWAAQNLNLDATTFDRWNSQTVTALVPIDATIMQVGFMVQQSGYSTGALNVDNVVVTVPEPTSASLLGLGLAGLLASRLRRRS